VLSHARNLLILKVVGFAEAVVQYYCMENARARVDRPPALSDAGRVWHPGGCHPFIGMNEALVHNGDFANYHSVCEYLAQRNLFPQFLTDTEASIMLFDLMNRVYKYPIEYIIEALAPTTELDFDRLPLKSSASTGEIQAAQIHASPDGPWFFIIARNLAEKRVSSSWDHRHGHAAAAGVRVAGGRSFDRADLLGKAGHRRDARQSGQGEDPRFSPVADMYWNARGGSSTDGGAFLLNVTPEAGGVNGEAPSYKLEITNKFGAPVSTRKGQVHCDFTAPVVISKVNEDARALQTALDANDPSALFGYLQTAIEGMDYNRLRWCVKEIAGKAAAAFGIEVLTLCIDRRYPTGAKKRSSVIVICREGLESIFSSQPLLNGPMAGPFRRITWDTRALLRGPGDGEKTLLIDARGFQPEGDHCDAYLAVDAFHMGWRHIVHYNSRGTRFHAAGFGPATDGLRIDCYDNPGDYLGSGIDGLEAYVHGNAQDQLCQISKRGKVVVYGDVGQTFLYGAKGGDIYVMGNAAGRPMINAVGRPKVVINGTALDFLAESFMAGDPLTGGGFAIVNGLRVEDNGDITALELPYPGSNLLSLASGGAIYVRDPGKTLVAEQLNGGVFRKLKADDWKLIEPYLRENERLFDIRVERDLLTVGGERRKPAEVYRKVMPKSAVKKEELEEEEVGE
jgi:glutamate synthase domain-containing protein 3